MTKNVSAIVLAGGASRRMGEDKAWVPFEDEPMIKRVLRIIAPQAKQTFIACGRPRVEYAELGYPLVADSGGQLRGPLAGAASARHLITTEFVLIVPCDMPRLPTDLGARLMAEICDHDIAVVHDGERRQHLVFVARTDVLATIGSYWEQGGKSVREWIDGLDAVEANFADRSAFLNVNRPEDLT